MNRVCALLSVVLVWLATATAASQCVSCPREGHPDLQPIQVVGWKVWVVTPQSEVKTLTGRTLAACRSVPDDGVLVWMLYYDRFNTSGDVRYRRIEQGSDTYFCAPGMSDVLYGHSDDKPDTVKARYPGAVVKLGKWADDATYRRVVNEAMDDFGVSAFGVTPVPGTSDR